MDVTVVADVWFDAVKAFAVNGWSVLAVWAFAVFDACCAFHDSNDDWAGAVDCSRAREACVLCVWAVESDGAVNTVTVFVFVVRFVALAASYIVLNCGGGVGMRHAFEAVWPVGAVVAYTAFSTWRRTLPIAEVLDDFVGNESVVSLLTVAVFWVSGACRCFCVQGAGRDL